MTIGCLCDTGDADWWWTLGDDFQPLGGKRRRRCHSCKTLVPLGADVVEVIRWKNDECGSEVSLASWYLCETCGGLAYALNGLNYCYDLDEPLKAQINEYVQMYGKL